MTEEERLQTLGDLREAKKEVSGILDRMPVAFRQKTIAQERYKDDCEKKLKALDRAIEKYERKMQYVPL